MEEKKEFTGVWIPRHIIEDKELSITEMIIYAEISCFDICFKTNQRLGERYNLKPNTISIIISKLVKKGYIFSNQKTGEYRELVANRNNPYLKKFKEPLLKKSNRLFEKNQTIDNIEKKEENKIAKTSFASVDNLIKNETLKQKIDNTKISMNCYEFVEWTKNSPQKHIEIISAWAEATKPKLENKAQWNEFISRNCRVAKKLAVFTEKQITSAFIEVKKMSENGEKFSPTLETLFKILTR